MSDTMLLGVLRMPVDDHGDLHLMQFMARAREAADRIERDARRIAELEQWQREMVAKAADDSLEGYRELGRRAAKAEQDAEDWHQAAAGLSADLTSIGQQHDALATFVNEAIDAAFAGCGLDGAWIQERAEQLGLLTAEDYDPERHPDADGTLFEPGDTIYVRQPWMARAGEDAE